MKNCISLKNQATRRTLLNACALAIAAAFAFSVPAVAGEVTPPPVPDGLKVEKGNVAFLVGHATGTQNYICLPSGSGFAYSLFTPEATLFNDDGDQIITHFFSPNPDENGTIRATWESSRDTSTVWAATVPGGAAIVSQDAVAWLLLEVKGRREGPDGGHRLTDTTFIQRLNTVGGVPPRTGCASPADVGTRAFVSYTADYFFYRKEDR